MVMIEKRLTWQSDATDLEMRADMIQTLRKLFWKNFVKTEKQALERKRKSDSMTEEPMLDKPKRLKSKLPIFLRQIETFLYLNAPSRDAYLDKTTLRQRIKELRDLQLN